MQTFDCIKLKHFEKKKKYSKFKVFEDLQKIYSDLFLEHSVCKCTAQHSFIRITKYYTYEELYVYRVY